MKSLQTLAEDLDQEFGMELAQQLCWQDLYCPKKLTIIEETHLTQPKWIYLKKQYEKEAKLELNTRRVVTIINSMFTQNRALLVIDRQSCRKLFPLDSNWKAQLGMSNDHYREFLKMLYSHPAIECFVDGKRNGTASVIKLTEKAITMFAILSPEEVEIQSEEILKLLDKQLTDNRSDSTPDLVGSREYPEECSKKEAGSNLKISTSSSFPSKIPSNSSKEEKNSKHDDFANINPSLQWSSSLLKIESQLYLTSGFTKAYLESLKELLESENLPVISLKIFEHLLFASLIKRFKETDTNPDFSFKGRYCQEIKANAVSIFESWSSKEQKRIEDSPETFINRNPFPYPFVELCELAEKLDFLSQVYHELLVALKSHSTQINEIYELNHLKDVSLFDVLELLICGYKTIPTWQKKGQFLQESVLPVIERLKTKFLQQDPMFPTYAIADTFLGDYGIGSTYFEWKDITKDKNDGMNYLVYLKSKPSI